MERPRNLADWERVLRAAAHLQEIFPDAVLVGGTAAAIHAGHRYSADADHTLADLRKRFHEVLNQLEAVAGWKTNRIQPPVLILGNLDGIETGIRQLIRTKPLETTTAEFPFGRVVLPTLAEMLRIKAMLILGRNATRDYIDFVGLVERLQQQGEPDMIFQALGPLDELYPQRSGESATRQLAKQLAEPKPYDLDAESLEQYRLLQPEFASWSAVRERCLAVGVQLHRWMGREPSGGTPR